MSQTWSDIGVDESRLRSGEQKLPCPSCGPDRKHPNDTSLSVNTDTGLFKCHNCDLRGRIGGRDHITKPAYYNRKVWKKPDAAKFEQTPQNLNRTILDWFSKVRGISEQTLLDHDIKFGEGFSFKVKEGDTWSYPDGKTIYAIYFPYRRDGELINVKIRKFQPEFAHNRAGVKDDEKDFRLAKDAEKIFWQIDRMGPTTLICEGEIDLLTFYEAGYHNVISVPNGSNVEDFMNSCADELRENAQRFILALDGDKAGLECRNMIALKLGKEQCLYVNYPEGCKDANEVWLKYGKEGIDQLVAGAKYFPIEGLIQIRDLADELEFYYDYGMPKGSSTGFPSLDTLYRIPSGSFSIWTGRPSSGKSTILSQVLINLAENEGWPIGIFSAEDNPTASLAVKLMMKHVGKPFDLGTSGRMTKAEMAEAIEWLDDHFHPIAPTSSTWSVDEVLKLSKSAVYQYGIKALVMDPWNEFDHTRPPGMGEQEYYSHALSKMRQFGRDNDCHVFLVAHPRKGDRMKKDGEIVELPPDLDDISGSSAFRAKADFGIVVHRDLTEEVGPGKPRQVHVNVLKVRQPWHGSTGRATLEWNPTTGVVYDPQTGPKPLSPEQLKELEDW